MVTGENSEGRFFSQRRKGHKGVKKGFGSLGLNSAPLLLYYSLEPSCAKDPVVRAL